MFICEKCKQEFQNITQLASHLSHPKSKCKVNIKEYYDQYLRKPNEGICIYCNKETLFYGLIKGYPNNKCKHCRNRGEKTQELRNQTFEKNKESKKIESGYYKYEEECQLCKKRFKNRQGLSKHISKKHSEISMKEYYDQYFKKGNEGICLVTGKETNFKNLVDGYYKYIGKGTNSADYDIQNKKQQTLFKNYGVYNAIEINKFCRIKSFKDTLEKKRKLKNERNKLLNVLKIITINKNNKFQCQICGTILKENYLSITKHILKKHKISINDYYDLYFKKYKEGICKISNEKTKFVSLKDGYNQYVNGYQYNSIDVVNKIKNKLSERFRKKVLKLQYKYNIQIVDINKLNKVTDTIEIKCLKCNEIYLNKIYNIFLGYGKCNRCFPKFSHTSKLEKEVCDFIKLIYNDTIIENFRDIVENSNNKKLELDIFLPKNNIAIEFNGLYWHSEKILEDPEHYHINKTLFCKNKNIELIHIFEDEWIFKRQIVKAMLLHKIGLNKKEKIHARKCEIKEISSCLKNNFLDMNHIQGKDSSTIKLGAYYDDKLIAVMTFSYGNISKGGNPKNKYLWELNRFATDLNYIIPGIASKLLIHFKRNYAWKQIYSYADLRWSTGKLYYKLGFTLSNTSSPNYWYVHPREPKRIYRFNLRKKSHEPKDIPEWKLRQEQGYYRIWDCGNLKFVLNNETFEESK